MSKSQTENTSASSSNTSGGFSVSAASGFLNDSVDELKKVTQPTRQETIQATLVTLVIIIFVALCLFLLDILFSNIMGAVLAT